jgi:hypothetical protein
MLYLGWFDSCDIGGSCGALDNDVIYKRTMWARRRLIELKQVNIDFNIFIFPYFLTIVSHQHMKQLVVSLFQESVHRLVISFANVNYIKLYTFHIPHRQT